jgi:predicted  nucleic acid-binding Zn-ribbon protein
MLIPFLILISLAAIGLAAYALSKQPSTSNLDARISSLSTQLTQAKHKLAAVESQTAGSATAGNVQRVNRNLAGLKKSVGGVQNAVVPLRAELNSLRVCLPQLQAEVTGVAAHAKQKGVTTVGLSPECSSFFGAQTPASTG